LDGGKLGRRDGAFPGASAAAVPNAFASVMGVTVIVTAIRLHSGSSQGDFNAPPGLGRLRKTDLAGQPGI